MRQPELSRRALLTATVLVASTSRAGAIAGEAPVEPRMRLARRPGERFMVALTLDACPGAFDLRIADGLVALGVPATVFVTGRWIRLNPDGLAYLLAHRDVFDIENHGDRHVPPVLGHRRIFGIESAGDLADVRSEVARGAVAIAQATGRAPGWYRAATGFYSPVALREVRRMGVGVGGYSLNADQGASLPAWLVAGRIAQAADGDVIVAHVNQPHRVSGPGVVSGVRALKDRGARFVRLDRLGPSDVVYG
jgi:peptidoglycan/xylan/chitin deacetylase (PgdA/CDA1 family)